MTSSGFNKIPIPKYGEPKETAVDNSERVLRGGSWYFNRHFARSAYRDGYDPGNRLSYLGFRVVVRSSPISS